MIVAFGYCEKDRGLAQSTLALIRDMGSVSDHDMLLVAPDGTDMRAETELCRCFKSVRTIHAGPDEGSWPRGANQLFQAAARYLKEFDNRPFTWLEPDAIPVTPDWLNRIASEYAKCGRLFMGTLMTKGTPHMNGVGVYPMSLNSIAPDVFRVHDVAWDLAMGAACVGEMHNSPLFFWDDNLHEVKSLAEVPAECVIYHRQKTDALAKLLRANKFEKSTNQPEGAGSSPAEFAGSRSVKKHPESSGAEEQKPALSHPLLAHLPLPNVIYTYHEQVNGMGDQEPLLALWRERWKAAGFVPIVLGREHAGPFAHEFIACVSKLPSVNPPGYDLACYLRWFAMAQVGGGIMCDYDVMPNGIKPFVIPNSLIIYETHDVGVVPSMAAGTADEYARICELFTEYKPDAKDAYNGNPHTSDMLILRRFPKDYDIDPLLRHFGDDDWQKAPAVHFPHIACKGESKVTVIRRELPNADPVNQVERYVRTNAPLTTKKGKHRETRDEMLARMAALRAKKKP